MALIYSCHIAQLHSAIVIQSLQTQQRPVMPWTSWVAAFSGPALLNCRSKSLVIYRFSESIYNSPKLQFLYNFPRQLFWKGMCVSAYVSMRNALHYDMLHYMTWLWLTKSEFQSLNSFFIPYLAVWLKANYLNPLCFNFLIYKVGLTIISIK